MLMVMLASTALHRCNVLQLENKSDVKGWDESTIANAGDFGSSGVSTRIQIIRAHESGRRLGDWRCFVQVELEPRWLVKSDKEVRDATGSELAASGRSDRINRPPAVSLTRQGGTSQTDFNSSCPLHQRCNAIPNLEFHHSSPHHASVVSHPIPNPSPTALLPPAPPPSIDPVLRLRIQLFL
jgi:hypothetical protein